MLETLSGETDSSDRSLMEKLLLLVADEVHFVES